MNLTGKKKTAFESSPGGHQWIYEELLGRLAHVDVMASAANLGLDVNASQEALVPLFGTFYRVSRTGVERVDGGRFADTAGSVLIHYILQGSRSRPAGRFVNFAELAGPLFKQSSYSQGALERPIIKRFQGRLDELAAVAELLGGRRGGEGGLGSVSWIFELLPHILLQLVFYDRDDEFPARATLLFDRNATRLIEFEVVAVLVTLFVHALTHPIRERPITRDQRPRTFKEDRHVEE